MGLNLYQGRVIYDEILRYRVFPEGLFIASEPFDKILRSRLGPVFNSK